MKKKLLVEIAVIAYILLFSYAAASKLLDMELFVFHLQRQAFSPSLIPVLSWGVPLSELVIVLMLVLPRFRVVGLISATVLMLVFTVYVMIAVLGLFRNVPCSCGGVISTLTWKEHLLFNLFFLLLGILALWPPLAKREIKLS
nr:MauE/DoxX family redox-associated membrane protein [uncultured Chitinophaga sp.]